MVAPNTYWWVPFYPADNMQRPRGPLCDGCHSVNDDIRTDRPVGFHVGGDWTPASSAQCLRRVTRFMSNSRVSVYLVKKTQFREGFSPRVLKFRVTLPTPEPLSLSKEIFGECLWQIYR